MKKAVLCYEDDHGKIALLVEKNERYKTMADGVRHIIERYEALVRTLTSDSEEEE